LSCRSTQPPTPAAPPATPADASPPPEVAAAADPPPPGMTAGGGRGAARWRPAEPATTASQDGSSHWPGGSETPPLRPESEGHPHDPSLPQDAAAAQTPLALSEDPWCGQSLRMHFSCISQRVCLLHRAMLGSECLPHRLSRHIA